MELWRELKEWRKHWNPRKFLVGLIFGLATSLFDFGADFNFAWSVPEDCQNTTATNLQSFDKAFVSSPCGLLYYKNVERTTFTYIAFPGFLLVFSSTCSLIKGLVFRHRGRELHAAVRSFRTCLLSCFGSFSNCSSSLCCALERRLGENPSTRYKGLPCSLLSSFLE